MQFLFALAIKSNWKPSADINLYLFSSVLPGLKILISGEWQM